MPVEDDDPVIASYNVFVSPQPTLDPSKPSPKLYILQYPSHRPHTKPYTSSRSQKPSSVRIKPNTGILEIDIPLFTSEHYNPSKGHEYGKAMHDSKQHNPYTSHGLSGGFSQNPPANPRPQTLSDIPFNNGNTHSTHSSPPDHLIIQTLGGKVAPTSDKTPVYMLATMNSKTRDLHLTHVDAVVQLRPQLHHIDALEDQKRRAEAASKTKPGTASISGPSINNSDAAPAPVKLETKAIEMKIKDASKEDPNRSINMNAKLLREIQADRWHHHDWIERGDTEAFDPPIHMSSTLFSHTRTNTGTDTDMPRSSTTNTNANQNNTTSKNITQLKSALDNDEWLNKMSSPGIELRTRLKGRDRERARRKRQERLRAARTDTTTAVGTGPSTSNTAGVASAAGTTTVGVAGVSSVVAGKTSGPFVEASGSDTGDSLDEEDEEQDEEDMVIDTTAAPERQNTATASRDTDEQPRTSRSRGQQQPQTQTQSGTKVQIKQEQPIATAATTVAAVEKNAPGANATTSTTMAGPTSTPTPKRRGRPPKKEVG